MIVGRDRRRGLARRAELPALLLRPRDARGLVSSSSAARRGRRALLGIGLREGFHPVHSRVGWQAWTTERLMDLPRDLLFPLYSSLFTPVWLRLLGAEVGRDVEASTVLAPARR